MEVTMSHFDVLKINGRKCALTGISVGVFSCVQYPSLAYLTAEAVMGLLIRESPWFMPSLRQIIIRNATVGMAVWRRTYKSTVVGVISITTLMVLLPMTAEVGRPSERILRPPCRHLLEFGSVRAPPLQVLGRSPKIDATSAEALFDELIRSG